MEVIKLGFNLLIEFFSLEKKLIGTLIGILVAAWAIGLAFGGGYENFEAMLGWAGWAALLGVVIASFAVPKFVKSSFKEINYCMDWLFYIMNVPVAAIYSFLVAWPILACFA